MKDFYIEGWFPIPEPDTKSSEKFVQIPLYVPVPEMREINPRKEEVEHRRGVIIIDIAGQEEEENGLIQFDLDC